MIRPIAAIIVLLWFSGPASALEFFHTRGGHSLAALFGRPAPIPGTDDPEVRRQGQFLITGSHANMFSGGTVNRQSGPDESRTTESLFIDGERTEVMFSYFREVNQCLGVGVELPFVTHSNGYFDNAIESWHDIFGLPNSNRDDVEQDSLSIRYTDPSGQSLTLESSSGGPGDLFVHFMRPMSCRNTASKAHGGCYSGWTEITHR